VRCYATTPLYVIHCIPFSSRSSKAPTGRSSTANDSVQRASHRAARTQGRRYRRMYPIHPTCDFATMSHRIRFRNSESTSLAKTIHHKVAARAVCVFSEQDALVAARAVQHKQHQQQQQEQHQQHQHPHAQHGSQNAASSPSGRPSQSKASTSFSFAQGSNNVARRPAMQAQGLGSMGGGSVRPPGKSGLTFDHMLRRLQGELQKTRETGAELHNLTGAMNDMHDTLGGSGTFL
jgi:hypothetical protein